MLEIKAAADAAEALGKSAEKVTSVFLKLETSGNNAAKGLKDFLTSENFTGATKGELNALGGKDGSFSLENYKTALEKANIKTDEDAKAFGFDSLADMQS
jgi:hypothetical protein